jgi:methylenetetrahydrofolate dehydrogenase (NADP+)/methenyltetrahydrofolate cyclohydrolase
LLEIPRRINMNMEIDTKIFEGKVYAQEKLEGLAERVGELRRRHGIEVKMGSIYLTTDPSSVLYTKIKKRKAEEIGIVFEDYLVDQKDTNRIISKITEWNVDKSFQGILVQKPSGKGGFSDEEWNEIVSAIDPGKDIDGLTYANLGHLLGTKEPSFVPATVRAVLEIINRANFDPRGKDVVIIGSSIIMGLPLGIKLIREKASVAVLNDETEDVPFYTKNAGLIVTATGINTGVPRQDWRSIVRRGDIRDGVVIIDVASPNPDVIKEEAEGKASFLTPVPNGVGPVTVTCLLENLVESVERELV